MELRQAAPGGRRGGVDLQRLAVGQLRLLVLAQVEGSLANQAARRGGRGAVGNMQQGCS